MCLLPALKSLLCDEFDQSLMTLFFSFFSFFSRTCAGSVLTLLNTNKCRNVKLLLCQCLDKEVQNYQVSVVPLSQASHSTIIFLLPKTEQVQNYHVSVIPHPKMNKCRIIMFLLYHSFCCTTSKCRIIKFLLRNMRNYVSSVCHCLVKLMLSHRLIAKHTCTQRMRLRIK